MLQINTDGGEMVFRAIVIAYQQTRETNTNSQVLCCIRVSSASVGMSVLLVY